MANGSPMFTLCEKIKFCREALVNRSKTTVDSRRKVKEKMTHLDTLMQSNSLGCNQTRIKSIQSQVNDMLHADEVYWRQRSRSTWLESGDKNTRFFHQQASQRR
jgi:hypothetical protein